MSFEPRAFLSHRLHKCARQTTELRWGYVTHSLQEWVHHRLALYTVQAASLADTASPAATPRLAGQMFRSAGRQA